MTDNEIVGKGRLLVRKSGYNKKTGYGGYEYVYLSIPSNIAKDSLFPFKNGEDVNISLKEGKLTVRKANYLMDLMSGFGIKNFILANLIERKSIKNKDKALILYKNRKYTYMEINENSNRIANGILRIAKELPLKRGKYPKTTSKIALMFPNNPDFLCCWFGIVKAGYIFVPINSYLEGDDLFYVLDHCDANVLIIDYVYLNEFEKIKNQLPKIKKVYIKNAPENFAFSGIYDEYQKLFNDNTTFPNIDIKFLDPMEIIYTEGTTGKPKGILYRNLMLVPGLIFSRKNKEYGQGGVIYCPLPLFHMFAQLVVVFPAFFIDATIALAENFNAKTYWDDARRFNSDIIVYHGGMIQALIDQPPSDLDRKHTVKWAVGSEAPKELWEVFENRFGVTIFEGWGATEAVGITINTFGSKRGKVGSIGSQVDGFSIKVVDSEGNELPFGKDNVGEFIMKMNHSFGGTTSNVSLLEYYKTPENTPMIVQKNGFAYTGDMGYKDKDGYFYLLGRKVDIIKKHDKLIYPIVIENIANAHPSILESAAFGVPVEDSENEDIKICVVLKRNRETTHEELHYYLSENLAYFNVPRYIEIKKELRSSMGRIKKYLLKKEWDEMKIKKLTWDSETKNFMTK